MNIQYKEKVIAFFILIIILFYALSSASDQIPSAPQSKPIALVGGAIHPVDGAEIEKGTVLFEKGKITALGADVRIPSDAVKVDISGKHVYPGMIDVNSQLGLVEINSVRGTIDIQEKGNINPDVRAEMALNPDSERIPVTRSNGIALACALPSGGVLSGKAALFMLDGWTWESMTLKAPVGLVISGPNMEVIEKAFTEAKAYKAAREAAGKKETPFHKTDVRWEAMLPVLRGELPVWMWANTLQEIETAVEWADREKVKLVILGGRESPLAADLLKRKNIPVVVTPILDLPRLRDCDYDEPFTVPSKLFKAGVKFCISGTSADGNDRNLPYHAAMASAFGLPREEALKSVTQYVAEILGAADRVGTLAKGKDATLIVTSGDPLEITTQVEKMYIQGREIDLNNKQKTLYRKYQEKYRQLSGR
jgi:imidazolonepropionase-like amidohydrolase